MLPNPGSDTSITPFSDVGQTSYRLQLLINLAAEANQVSLGAPACDSNGRSRCIHPIGEWTDDRPTKYGISTLGDGDNSQAICKRASPSNSALARYTGSCQSTAPLGQDESMLFLIECRSNRANFVEVQYSSEPNQTSFKAYGEAKALFSDIFVSMIDLYKQEGTAQYLDEDLYVFCG